jgi:hypothetical protein
VDFLGDSRDVRDCDWAYRHRNVGKRLDRISCGFTGSVPHRDAVLGAGNCILGFEPATDGQSVLHAEALRAFNTFVELRRLRIEATSYAVPGPLWVVVLIGAAIAIFASYLFNVESLLAQSLLTTLLASMIALLVFFIATTDHPYRGINAIGPLAYEIVLRNLTNAP